MDRWPSMEKAERRMTCSAASIRPAVMATLVVNTARRNHDSKAFEAPGVAELVEKARIFRKLSACLAANLQLN